MTVQEKVTGIDRFSEDLIRAGIDPDHVFSNQSSLQTALIAALASQFGCQETCIPRHEIRPIALGWRMDKLPPENRDFEGLQKKPIFLSRLRGSCSLLSQKQPPLEETSIGIFETKLVTYDRDLLRRLFNYTFSEGDEPEINFLKSRSEGLGLAHARAVVYEFTYGSSAINKITPIEGPKALGRSIFILLDYRAFANAQDVEGTQQLAWCQLQVISKTAHSHTPFIAISFHYNIGDVLIPEESLVVVANLKWFR